MAQAEPLKVGDVLEKIPNVKTGFAYSIDDAKFNALATVDVAKWKGFSLEAGYSGAASETRHKAVAVISYDLFHVGDHVQFPILDKVVFRPGIWAGLGGINFKEMTDAEFTWGVSVTALEWKF